MYEDAHLDSYYEDRYTIQGDWDAEDDLGDEDEEDEYDEEDEVFYENEFDDYDTSARSHEYDEMRYPEWMERSYTH